MRDRARFAAATMALGVNARVEVSDAQRNLFWTFLGDLTDEQFEAAVARWIQHQRWFPHVSELRELVTPVVDHSAEAVRAFEAVIKLGEYTPVGMRWSERRISEQLGPAAAQAYVAAGASSAFETELGERDFPFLRKRFVESYVTAAEAVARGQQLAPPTLQRLPGDTVPTPRLVAGAAGQLPAPRQGVIAGGR